MPFLNNRDANVSAALTSNRAAQIQLNLMKRDVPTARNTVSQSPEKEKPRVALTTARDTSLTRTVSEYRPAGRSASIGGSRIECGNPGCSKGWTPPWRSRRYPFFEDKWSCSQRCTLAMVKAAIAREMGDGEASGGEVVEGVDGQHRHRVPLGLVMLAQGWITHPQLRKALEMQRLRGKGRIGDWLVSECGLKSEWVTRGLSVQWNCPVLTTEGFSPETMARSIPRLFIEEYGILPVRVAGRKILYLGFQDQIDASSAFAVEKISGMRTECGVVNEERFRKAKDAVLGCRFLELKRTIVADRDALGRSIERAIAQRKPTSARLVRLHKYYWLRMLHEDDAVPRAVRQIPAAGEATDWLFTIGS